MYEEFLCTTLYPYVVHCFVVRCFAERIYEHNLAEEARILSDDSHKPDIYIHLILCSVLL